jgi:hypothetical protein
VQINLCIFFFQKEKQKTVYNKYNDFVLSF